MKKLKLFTLAIAALFASSTMAEDYSLESLSDGTTLPYTFEGSSVSISAVSTFTIESKQMTSDKSYKPYGIKISANANSNIDTSFVEISSTDDFITGLQLYASSTGDSQQKYSVLYCSEAPFGKDNVISGEVQTSLSKKSTENTPQTFTIPSGVKSIRIYRKVNYNGTDYGDGKTVYLYGFKITTTPQAKDIATLKSITIDGVALEGFDPATESYNVTLPYGTTTVPTVAAVCTSSKANAVVTPAADVNSAATIVVTAEDGTTTKTYTINFSVAATQSSNAFLRDLTVDGKTISGFKKDSFNYNYQVAYNKTEYPVVAATVEDATATPVISQITSYPASATVVVTAQDGTTQKTYTINFTKATYPKVISSIVFSNGAKGAANESEATVKVPYLSTDAAAPTISEITVLADNEYIKADDESTITVSSKTDLSSLVYNVTKVALTPASIATNEEIAFDGTESYVFSTYGFDASKGWKFAKAKEDESNRRVSDGRSRIYFALPAAKEVVLTSGDITGRAIKVYVNNVKNTDVTTTAKNGSITIALNQNAANLVAIESNQTDGDGGFIKIKLVPVDGGNPGTSIDAINSNATAVKRIVNGQLVIEKNGVLYNALGNVVK